MLNKEKVENTQLNRMELKRRLQHLEAQIAVSEPTAGMEKPARFRRVWAAVAVVCAGAMVLFYCRSFHDNRLFENYYQPYPNVVTFVERAPDANGPKDEALQLYEQGHYCEALGKFEKSHEERQATPSTLFYAGIACIETNRLEEAEQYLLMAAQQPDSAFSAQAQWYLALVHVKKDERKKAATYLTTLVRHTEAYKDKAQRLLNEL